MFTSLCYPNKVVGAQKSVSREEKGHDEEVQASSSSITDDQLRFLLLKAVKPAIRDKSSTLDLPDAIQSKNDFKISRDILDESKIKSSHDLHGVRITISESIEETGGRRRNEILDESYGYILVPMKCCDCSGGVSAGEISGRDESVDNKEVKDLKNTKCPEELSVSYIPDNQKQIDTQEGDKKNKAAIGFSTLINKTYVDEKKSLSSQSVDCTQNLVPIEFCGLNGSGNNGDSRQDRICATYPKICCHHKATKQMLALTRNLVHEASSISTEKGFATCIYSSGNENRPLCPKIPCRSQTYSRFENYCSDDTFTMHISDDLEFAKSGDDDDDSDISFDSITKIRILPENLTFPELQQCITLEKNIESQRIELSAQTEDKRSNKDNEICTLSNEFMSGDHQAVTFDSTSNMSNLSLGEYQATNELALRPFTNAPSSVFEKTDNYTLEEHFSDIEEFRTKARIDGIPESVIVPSDENITIPSEKTVIVPSDESVIVPSDESVIVPSDESVIVPSGEEEKDSIAESVLLVSDEDEKCVIPESVVIISEKEGRKEITESAIVFSDEDEVGSLQLSVDRTQSHSPNDVEERCPRNGVGEVDEDDDSIIKESAGAECKGIFPRVSTGLYGLTEKQLSSDEELALIDPSLLRISPHLMKLAKTLDKMDKRACNVTLRLHKKSKKLEEERSRKRANILDSSSRQRPTAVQMRQQMNRSAKLKKYESYEEGSTKNSRAQLGCQKKCISQDESMRTGQKGSLTRITKAAYGKKMISLSSKNHCPSRSSQRSKQSSVNRFTKRTYHPENHRVRNLNLIHLKADHQRMFLEVKDDLPLAKRKQQYQLQQRRKVHSRLHRKTEMLREDTRQGESVPGESCNRDKSG